MAKMDVTLPAPMREWVRSRIESGLYADASDYIRDLIRHDRKAADEILRLGELDEMIAEGLADIAAGRVVEADEVFDELEVKYAAMEEQTIKEKRKAG